MLQYHARTYHLPLSNLQFKHIVKGHQQVTEDAPIEKVLVAMSCECGVITVVLVYVEQMAPPGDGVLVHGLYLQGAAWDTDRSTLCEQSRIQQSLFPLIHFLPEEVGQQVRFMLSVCVFVQQFSHQ